MIKDKREMAKFSAVRVEEEEEEEEEEQVPTKKQRKMKDEDESNYHNGNSVRPNRDDTTNNCSSSISVTLMDPEVLDCSICMESLSPPVFQCENGHIACSTCCTKLGNKCPSCAWPIGYNRCLAIEKVIESIKVFCRHKIYGCRETFSYKEKTIHEEACVYAPCTCPIADCMFCGSFEQLSLHFSSKHWSSAQPFQYNCPFSVSFDKSEPFLVFRCEEDGLLFLLNSRTELIGSAIMLSCIGPSSSKGGFLYDLITKRGASSLRLQAFAKCVKGRIEGSSSIDFLLVPCDYYRSSGKLKMEVCIWSSRENE